LSIGGRLPLLARNEASAFARQPVLIKAQDLFWTAKIQIRKRRAAIADRSQICCQAWVSSSVFPLLAQAGI
jgi:hypothetical protein